MIRLPFEAVTQAFDISKAEGYALMRIPQSTYRKRLEQGKLTPSESERVYSCAQLITQATEMMCNDREKAITWFKTPLPIIRGETPLEHAVSEIGVREVNDIIGRIRYGVFS